MSTFINLYFAPKKFQNSKNKYLPNISQLDDYLSRYIETWIQVYCFALFWQLFATGFLKK